MIKNSQLLFWYIPLLITTLSCQLGFSQFNIPEKPTLETSVYDNAGILTSNQVTFLEQKLIKYADSTSTQIVIATVKTLHGDDISLTAANWGHEWGVGNKDKDNGIFILIASEDRKIDISTGYGIEYHLTDLMTERILNRIILPEFKQGDYFSGLDKGTTAIFQVLSGEFKAPKEDRGDFHVGISALLGTMFFIIIFILISKGRKNNDDDYKGGKRKRGLSPFETIILSSGGRSYGGSTGTFGGGGFSGGGFSGGFGGGGFGGGGASGSW